MEQASVQRPGAGRDRRGQVLHFSYVSQTHPVAASLSNYAIFFSPFFTKIIPFPRGRFLTPAAAPQQLEQPSSREKLSHAHRTPRPGSCAPHPAHNSKQRISTLLPSRERLATPCALRSPLRPRTVLTPTHPLFASQSLTQLEREAVYSSTNKEPAPPRVDRMSPATKSTAVRPAKM